MQTFNVSLSSAASNTYYCRRAVDSVDLNVAEKLKHELSITADLETPYQIGLIIGASGSGKTTLAKSIFGEDCFLTVLDPELPILDQFPEHMDYDQRVAILSGIGLTQVPCWVRPVKTLSNGQKSRAEAALLMCKNELTVIDEWTSVVDRTVAKVMSHCLQKHARRYDKRVVVLSCHYDVIEWLNPDWVIDCNAGTYTDRRLLRQSFKRAEQLQFDIRIVGKETWRYFSKYHYLSHRPPPGHSVCYGLFHGQNQIGFVAFSNYIPHSQIKKLKNEKMMLHGNRLVIHPDYCGLGFSIKFYTESAKLITDKYQIYSKFSSVSIQKLISKNPHWLLVDIRRDLSSKGNLQGFRHKVKTYIYKFVVKPVQTESP